MPLWFNQFPNTQEFSRAYRYHVLMTDRIMYPVSDFRVIGPLTKNGFIEQGLSAVFLPIFGILDDLQKFLVLSAD